MRLLSHQLGRRRQRRQPARVARNTWADLQDRPPHRADHLAPRRQALELQDGPRHAVRLAARRPPSARRHDHRFRQRRRPDGPSAVARDRARLDMTTMTARSCASGPTRAAARAAARATCRRSPNGDVFVGWGAQPYLTEFSPDGRSCSTPRSPAPSQLLPRLPLPLERTAARRAGDRHRRRRRRAGTSTRAGTARPTSRAGGSWPARAHRAQADRRGDPHRVSRQRQRRSRAPAAWRSRRRTPPGTSSGCRQRSSQERDRPDGRF